jgi:hypothetical protein
MAEAQAAIRFDLHLLVTKGAASLPTTSPKFASLFAGSAPTSFRKYYCNFEQHFRIFRNTSEISSPH